MISPAGYPQIEGPRIEDWRSKPNLDGNRQQADIPKDKSTVLVFGYYHVNENPSNLISTSAAPFQLTTMKTKYPLQFSEVIQVIESSVKNDSNNHSYDSEELSRGLQNLKRFNTSFIFSRDLVTFIGSQI